VFAITLVVLAAPFLIASYLGYKAYYKSSWQKGERWSVIALLALLLALTGPPWVSAFFDGGQSQAKNQVVNNQNTQDVVNIKRNNTNRVERATTSTSSAEATKNQATTSTSSGKKEDKQLTNKSDAKTTDESSRDTEVNQRLSQSASTSNQNSNYGASGVSSANVNADSPTQDSIEPETNLNATIINVVDGDTADVRLANGTEKRLRLIGIDTPETKHPSKPVECFGKKATQKARSMLLGEQVTLEYDDSQGRYDKYDRLLTYVILPGGTNFNEVMVEKGYAYEYTYNVPYKYQDEFKQAERLARVNERGLWAPETCDGDRRASDDAEQETMDNN
jgi:micrococcal nuclease